MNFTRRIALWSVLLLSLARLAGCAQPKPMSSEELLRRLAETKPAYTEAQAQADVREVLPLVEEAAGRKFKSVPMLKLVRRDDLIPVVTEEITSQFKRIYPQLSDAEVKRAARSTAHSLVIDYLGKYGITTGKLYLLPRNFQPQMDLIGVDPKYRKQILKLVIAHELTHALHDQQLGIAQLQGHVDTGEKSLAFNAAMEGFAVFVQDKVADKLNIGPAAKELARLLASADSLKGLDPALEIEAKRVSAYWQGTYIQGRDFIAWQDIKGGIEQVWRVLAAPPVSTSQIYRPETYTPTAKTAIDYANVLKGLEQRLGKQKWTVDDAEAGEMDLRASYADLDEKSRDQILAGIEHAQRLIAASDQCEVRIGFIVCKDRSLAPILISAQEKISQSNFDKMSRSREWKAIGQPPAQFAEMSGKADLARRYAFTLRGYGLLLSGAVVQVARGRVVVYVYSQGLSIPGTKTAAIIEEIFKRLSVAP